MKLTESKLRETIRSIIREEMEYQKNLDELVSESKLFKTLEKTGKLFEQFVNEGITSETEKVANEFKKELIDMKKHFGSRLKDNTIYWGGYRKVMKASERSEGFKPSRGGIIPMYLYWMSKYRADKSNKYTELAKKIEKKGIKLEPLSDEKDGTDNWKIIIKKNLDELVSESKLFKTLEKTGKLIEPTGGASMNGKYYQLEGGSKHDVIHFSYDPKSKKPFGVAQIAGHHMPSQLLNRLGFRETRSWTAGVEVYIFDGNYNPKYLTDAEMAKLVNGWGKGFSSYTKSFAKFYQDRGRTSGTID